MAGRRADTNRLVSISYVKRVGVGLGIDGNAAYSKLAAHTHGSIGYFSPVRDQYPFQMGHLQIFERKLLNGFMGRNTTKRNVLRDRH